MIAIAALVSTNTRTIFSSLPKSACYHIREFRYIRYTLWFAMLLSRSYSIGSQWRRKQFICQGPIFLRRKNVLGCASTLYDGSPISLCTGGSLVGFHTVLLMQVSVSENEIVCYNVNNAITNAKVRKPIPRWKCKTWKWRTKKTRVWKMQDWKITDKLLANFERNYGVCKITDYFLRRIR